MPLHLHPFMLPPISIGNGYFQEHEVSALPPDIREMSFEAAMDALEVIVTQLESGQAPLEESIDLYTRGSLLKKHCEEKLAAAQSRIDKLTITDGEPTDAVPFDYDE